MNKKLFLVLLVAVLLPIGLIFAGNDKNILPEKDGIYSVPGHSNLKVRVFTHKAKPGPIVNPQEQCGLPDPYESQTIGSAGWHIKDGTYTYTLNTNVPSLVGSANLANIADMAFDRWQAQTNNKVTFVKNSVNTTKTKAIFDGLNIIAWGKAPASALGITYTWYNSLGEVVETDTIMNQKFLWAWSSTENCAYIGYYDAQNILTHELGHWLGMDDEYDASLFSNATMYGYGSPTEVKKNTLSSGDIGGMSLIY